MDTYKFESKNPFSSDEDIASDLKTFKGRLHLDGVSFETGEEKILKSYVIANQ